MSSGLVRFGLLNFENDGLQRRLLKKRPDTFCWVIKTGPKFCLWITGPLSPQSC